MQLKRLHFFWLQPCFFQFTHMTINGLHLSAFESFGFIFGVNHLFLNEVEAGGWFVTKTMIYSFLTTCPRLEGRGVKSEVRQAHWSSLWSWENQHFPQAPVALARISPGAIQTHTHTHTLWVITWFPQSGPIHKATTTGIPPLTRCQPLLSLLL